MFSSVVNLMISLPQIELFHYLGIGLHLNDPVKETPYLIITFWTQFNKRVGRSVAKDKK